MKSLFITSRFYILVLSVLLSVGIFFFVKITIPLGQLQSIRIEQSYGMMSLVYLYITLLAGPLCYTFPTFPFREQYLYTRRAFGVGVFYFAFLHGIFAFFGQLGGFQGLPFLGRNFLIAVILGGIALSIFFLLTLTSVDYAVKKMRFKNWKLLHRLVYIAGILVLIHALLLGTHYSTLSDGIPQITFIAVGFLLLLESPRIDVWIGKRFALPKFGLSTIIFATVLGGMYVAFITSSPGSVSFGIHAGHKQLALQAQQQQQFGVDITKIPGLDGDKNKRYTVSMLSDVQTPLPHQNVTLRFRIFDASSGNPVNYFKFIYAKKMHMIIVTSSLTYFAHIHPLQEGQDFVITTQFPSSDRYHIYIQFQPYGGIEQQVAFTLPVGTVVENSLKPFPTDVDNTTKIFGAYAVTLHTHGQLSASAMSLGNQEISFTIADAKTKKPITTLKPYLASFGHLTMINQQTYDFIHVHPYSLFVPPPDANGGPTIDFLPIGIYGSFTPGVYRAFAEFNPDGNLFTANFTIKVTK